MARTLTSMRAAALAAVFCPLLNGCASTDGQGHSRALVGALLGAAAGAAVGYGVDEDDRGRGAAIGAAGGAVVGGTIGHLFDRAAHQAAQENRRVVTEGENAGERVVATPVGREGNYRIVEVTYYDATGNVVRQETKRVPMA